MEKESRTDKFISTINHLLSMHNKRAGVSASEKTYGLSLSLLDTISSSSKMNKVIQQIGAFKVLNLLDFFLDVFAKKKDDYRAVNLIYSHFFSNRLKVNVEIKISELETVPQKFSIQNAFVASGLMDHVLDVLTTRNIRYWNSKTRVIIDIFSAFMMHDRLQFHLSKPHMITWLKSDYWRDEHIIKNAIRVLERKKLSALALGELFGPLNPFSPSACSGFQVKSSTVTPQQKIKSKPEASPDRPSARPRVETIKLPRPQNAFTSDSQEKKLTKKYSTDGDDRVGGNTKTTNTVTSDSRYISTPNGIVREDLGSSQKIHEPIVRIVYQACEMLSFNMPEWNSPNLFTHQNLMFLSLLEHPYLISILIVCFLVLLQAGAISKIQPKYDLKLFMKKEGIPILSLNMNKKKSKPEMPPDRPSARPRVETIKLPRSQNCSHKEQSIKSTSSSSSHRASKLKIVGRSQIEIGEHLGSGGFGDVYKSKLTLGEDTYEVAVKKMISNGFNQHDFAVFQREGQIMAGLDHVNIIKVFAICMDPSCYSLVMEYMSGGCLFDVLIKNNETILTQNWIDETALGIGKGLAYLHRNKIQHRDLKPENILLNKQGPKISDFGLSKIKGKLMSARTTGWGNGTLSYMAPEVMDNKRPEFKSDVFSLGVIFWVFYSRKSPWSDIKRAHKGLVIIYIHNAVLNDKKREVIPDNMPQSFAALVKKCWAQRSSERPSAQEVVDVLKTM